MSLQVWLPLNGDATQMGPNSATMTNSGVDLTYASGKIDKCAYFNGSSYLLSSTGPLSNSVNDWSYSCWFWADTRHAGCLFSSRSAVDTAGIAIFWYSDRIFFDDGVRWETSSSPVGLSQWVHLTFVRKKGVGKYLYVNGSLAASTTTTGTTTAAGPRFSIGQSQTAQGTVSGNAFKGWLNDVRIYNHALSAEEVAAIARTPNNYSGNSLQVWAPLTSMNATSYNSNLQLYSGTTPNQGTSGGNVQAVWVRTPNSADGKLGKGMGFNGAQSYLQGTYKATSNITFALWVYFDEVISGHVFDARTADASSGYQPIYVTPTTMQFGNTSTSFSNINYTWSAGQWYHICVTHDYNQGKVYIDGNLVATNTSAGGRDLGTCNFNIGCRCSHANFTKIRVNDVRIYNQTLTAEEVKNISRGLSMHYRLDHDSRSGNYLYNVFTGSGWSYSSFDADNCEYTRSTTATSESYILAPCSTYVLTGYTYTLSCLAKSNGYVSSMDMYKYNSKTQNIQSRTGISLTTSYQLYQWTFTPTATENVYFRFDNNGTTSSGTEAILYVKNPTLEVAPFSSLKNNSILEDSSGMGNHGTIVASVGCSPECSRFYTASSYFHGANNSCVQIPFTGATWPDKFTMSVWFRKDELGSKNYETLIGGPSGFEMDTRAGSASDLTLYMASTRGGNMTGNGFTKFNLNQWYMVTLVNDGTYEHYYVNGDLVKSIEKKSMPSGQYYIGAWRDTTSQNYHGLMSDVRIYATPLSATEVKALYNGTLN